MVTPSVLVFDMDGVLVEVGDSYRESIIQTVKHFTGKTVSRERVQEYKNRGGWNNDWALAQRIAEDEGVAVGYDTVVEAFNLLWKGTPGKLGLVARELWIAREGLLDELAAAHKLAIFTGRMRWEADITLERFAPSLRFDPIVCAEHVAAQKPAPDGLIKIAEAHPGESLLYFGDVVDDARAAHAAGVPFVGVVAAGHATRDTVVGQFRELNAVAVIENINQIHEVLG